MSNPYLEWHDPEGKVRRLDLLSEKVTIGRRSDCDLTFPFPYISGEHAHLVRDEEGYTLIDLGSTNGTFLNGEDVERARVRAGDIIQLGSLQISFCAESPVVPSPPEEVNETEDLMDLTTMIPGTEQTELEKLSLLLDLQVHWGERFSAESTFQQILRSALRVSQAERGFIVLREPDGLQYAAGIDANSRPLSEESFQASRTAVQRVLSSLEPEFRTEGLVGDDLAMAESIVAMNVHALACLPLLRAGQNERTEQEVFGVLYVDSTKTVHAMSGLDRRILSRLAQEASSVLEKAQMLEDLEQKRRLERELELAKSTQEGLLPRVLPEVPGFAVRALCRPTRYVGGDLYDFIPLDDGRLVAVLADVSGKGVAASLLSSSVQGALQMLFRRGLDPDEVLAELNRYLCERSEEGQFVTLFVVVLDEAGRGHFSSAGHHPSLVYRAQTKTVDLIRTSGLMLGAIEGVRYEAEPVELAPGDVLLIYSDGLSDAESPLGSLFEDERIVELTGVAGGGGADGLQEALLDALEGHTKGTPLPDDITLVLVERVREP